MKLSPLQLLDYFVAEFHFSLNSKFDPKKNVEKKLEDIEATPGCTRVANMIETGKTPLLTPGELHDLGFDLVVSPLTGLLAATRALARAYEVLRREGTLRDHLELVTTFDDFGSVIDLERHYGLEARYTDAGS